MEDQEIIETVKGELAAYLSERKLRKTPERFAILEQIYMLNDHFDVDTLYELMLNSGYRVSRATVYNTVDLLVECRLIVRHQFGTNMAHYEKAYNCGSHHHLICTVCNTVQEVQDDELHNIIQGKKYNKFNLTNYNLYMYGLCQKCTLASRKKPIHK
ncbi:MAG: Fur family transcriptional regulator [Bacteroidales bacterium]